jgi:SCF-associated factor 1
MQDLLQSQPPSSHIFAVPIEILFHTLIPILPLSSLLALTQTCKYFANVCSNETVWKVKLKEEFNYGGGGGADARVGGWKMLYKGRFKLFKCRPLYSTYR